MFFPARQHRGLRHALATAYLLGAKEPLAEYSANHVQLHALWEDCSSTPAALAERLPSAKQWRSFLEDWRDKVKDDPALQARARVRWESLQGSAVHTRELVLRILRENELIKD